jgi:hypothetical protein
MRAGRWSSLQPGHFEPDDADSAQSAGGDDELLDHRLEGLAADIPQPRAMI